MLARAFRRLTSLEAIDVELHNEWIGAKEIQTAMISPSGEEFLSDGEFTLQALVYGLKNSGRMLRSLRFVDNSAYPNRIVDDDYRMNSVTKVRTHISGRPYEPYRYDPVNSPSIEAMTMFAEMCSSIRGSVFSELKSLELRRWGFGIEEEEDDDDIAVMHNEIARLICSTPQLHELVLRVNTSMPMASFSGLIAGDGLHYLKLLYLMNFKIPNAKSLARFMSGCASTIESVEFLNVIVDEPHGWKKAVERMQKIKFRHLEQFQVEIYLYNMAIASDIADYVNGRSDECPILEK